MESNVSEPARYVLVETAGPEAPWIAMVHGVSQSHKVFERQLNAFKSDYRLTLIDLPGHGLSSRLPGPYGLEEYSHAIGAALEDAEIDRAIYWGTHLGAGTGLLLAARRPSLFRSLILEGPVFPGRPMPAVNDVLAEINLTAQQDGMPAAREKWWHDGPWFDVMRSRPQDCRAAAHRALIDEFEGQPWLDAGLASRPLAPIDKDLKSLQIPVLIYNGEHDVGGFLQAAAELHDVLPNSQRVTIKDAGGFPLWEYPERVNRAVSRFLASSQRSTG